MTYLIKRNLLSLAKRFEVKDENENDLYVVKSQISWGKKMRLEDWEGNELAFISQRVLSFMPVYVISKQGQVLAKVKQKINWFKKDVFAFKLIVPGSCTYQMKASFKDKECKFFRDQEVVALISKGFFTRSGTYTIDITGGEDHIVILAACFVLDRICDRTFANFEKHTEWD